MLFNSYPFILLFLPAALGVFAIVGKGGARPALRWLIFASLFFYGWWNPAYLPLLLGSIFFNYFAGALLLRPAILARPRLRRFLFTSAVAANLCLIGYFKYRNFFLDNISHLFSASFPLAPLVLPLGISFFTFQKIAYLVDIYRGEIRESHFRSYFLFVTFFPQLIAGPIVHYREVAPQFEDQNFGTVNSWNLRVGAILFCLGLFKKVVLADTHSIYAHLAFDDAARGEGLHFLGAWGGILAYTFQIYFDFSGYSDMAIGLARLFGVKLPLNFNSPYKAESVVDFWRRWHMTLSRFLLHYVYIPLGGNRKGVLRRYLNLLATMLLGGLWHGAAWTFVFWGALHGLYLIVNHAWRLAQEFWSLNLRLGPAASRILTFFCVVIAWIFFRADNLHAAFYFLKTLSGLGGMDLGTALRSAKPAALSFEWAWIVVSLAIVWLAPNSQEWLAEEEPALDFEKKDASFEPTRSASSVVKVRHAPSLRSAVFAGILAAVSLIFLFVEKTSEFLYFQF